MGSSCSLQATQPHKPSTTRKGSHTNPLPIFHRDWRMPRETVGLTFILSVLQGQAAQSSPNHPAPWQVFPGLFFSFPDGACHGLGQEAGAENAHPAQTRDPALPCQGAGDRKTSFMSPLPPNLPVPGVQVPVRGWA